MTLDLVSPPLTSADPDRWARVDDDGARAPWHRVRVDLGIGHHHAWLLRSLGTGMSPKRSTLVFRNPDAISTALPREVSASYDDFQQEFARLQRAWGFKAVPAMKRAIRAYESGESFQDHRLGVFAHRHGAVLAWHAGTTGDHDVALLAEAQIRGGQRQEYSESERLEILWSHSQHLPELFTAYYEQISYYLDSILFGASDQRATRFCLRVRELVGVSIRGKLRDIRHCPREMPRARKLAAEIQERHATAIAEAEAMDSFAHLLVNYIYRFFCIADRASEYHDRLAPLAGARDLYEDNTTSFLKRAAQNLLDPDDRFLDELEARKEEREPWLQSMGVASALLAEVVRFANGKSLAVPGIFITHHFNVKDSERMVWSLEEECRRRNVRANVIVGRKLEGDVRWSLLARIWFADQQVLLLPRSWDRRSGGQKALKSADDWVVRELFFGRRLEHPLATVVASPVSDEIRAQFLQQIADYTSEREIEQIPGAGWSWFVARAKHTLREHVNSRAFVECDIDAFGEGTMAAFEEHIRAPAARHLVRLFLDAWCNFFHPAQWSVAQALMEICRGAGYDADPVRAMNVTIGVRSLAEWIEDRKGTDPRFAWARSQDFAHIDNSVRRHLRDGFDHGLSSFAFRLAPGLPQPLVCDKHQGNVAVRFQLGRFYQRFCKHLAIDENPLEFDRIVRHLVTLRAE